MALNRACVGKSYPPMVTEVALDALQKYALAYNDDNPHYFDSAVRGGIVAPPMFNVVVTWVPLIMALTDPDLHADLLRLLHISQDMQFFDTIAPGDSISATAGIVSIENASGGELIAVRLDAANQRGAPVSRTCFTAMIRARRNRDGMADLESRGESPATSPILTVAQGIDADQTIRYAEASGDRNPIHIDGNVARMAGLPGVIVHGLCTMAFISKIMIDHLADGRPTRLKRLALRFARPVFPGDLITTRVWRESDRNGAFRFSFETSNPSGQVVIRDGIAEIAG